MERQNTKRRKTNDYYLFSNDETIEINPLPPLALNKSFLHETWEEDFKKE